jgi:dephospho-CoA kinase
MPAGKKRLVIGVTGGFGTGKSTVARILRSWGAKVVDADRIAHRLIQAGSPVYKRLVLAFGAGILKKDRQINRSALARIAFASPARLKRLNRIIHPEVIRMIKKEIKGSANKEIVLDAPLLIEAGLNRSADVLVVVKLARKKQIARLKKNTSLSRQDILKRIGVQMPLKNKVRMADFVIDNNGTIGQTRKQVQIMRRQLWKN